MGKFLPWLPWLLRMAGQPGMAALVERLMPVLVQAVPIFEQLGKTMPQDEAAQIAVATAAPYIETPRVDPLSGMRLKPGALTVEEEMGAGRRFDNN